MVVGSSPVAVTAFLIFTVLELFTRKVSEMFVDKHAKTTEYVKNPSCYVLSIDQISLSDSLYFFRYWAISVLKLFVNHKF